MFLISFNFNYRLSNRFLVFIEKFIFKQNSDNIDYTKAKNKELNRVLKRPSR